MSNLDLEVRPVVCDYGLYENGELRFICNSRRNALLIKAILEKDSKCNKDEYIFTTEDYEKFNAEWKFHLMSNIQLSMPQEEKTVTEDDYRAAMKRLDGLMDEIDSRLHEWKKYRRE